MTELFYDGVETYEGPNCHDGGIPGFGNISNGVVFIGISPAKTEMRERRPLVGASANVLNPMLDAAGIPRNQVYITNMICWWKDDPSPEEADKCKPRLDAELATIKPRLIVPLGELVTARFYPTRKFGAVRGSVLWFPEYDAYVMPTNHPAAVLNTINTFNNSVSSGIAANVLRDICKIPAILDWPRDDSLTKCEYTIVQSRDEAQTVLDGLSTDIPIAIDVETDNKDVDYIDVFVDKLLCLAISDGNTTFWFPRSVLDDLRWPDCKWTMHNSLFDAQVIHRHLGVWLKIHEDTMLQSYTVEERGGFHGLKPLSREYNGAGWWEEVKVKRGRVAELPLDKLQEYNSMDAHQTAVLQPKLLEMQVEDDTRGVYEKLILPGLNAFKEIQYRGIHVNKPLLNGFAVKWGQFYLDMQEELQADAEKAGWPTSAYGELNLSAPAQVGKFLYDIIGLPVPPNGWTKKGARSTKEEVMQILRSQHPWVEKMMQFRHVDHMYNVYILSMMEHIKYDGCVHPVLKLHGTVTGRLAYSDPPVQTIPPAYEVHDYVLPFDRLRRMFEPMDTSERVCIEADYGKAEIWMAYYRSHDQNLYRKLTSGDFHSETGVEILDKPREMVTEEERRDMKNVTFGIMYGQDEYGLAPRIKRSRAEARNYIDLFMEANYEYARYYQGIKKQILETNELITATGRKRRIIVVGNILDTRTQNQALNYEIQSTTSDCLFSAAIELHNILVEFDAYIMLTVHDSILIDAPKKYLKQVLALIHKVMTRARFPEAGIGPIPIGVKVGKSWGQVKLVHDCEKDKYGGCLYNSYRNDPIYEEAA